MAGFSLKGVWKLFLLSLWIGGMFAVWWIGVRIPFASRETQRRFTFRMKKRWAKGALWLANVRLTVTGEVPENSYFLASNHLGYLDIVLYWSVMDCVFLAKSEVAAWPGIGKIAKDLGTLFIDRGKKRDLKRVNTLVGEVLRDRQLLVVFPEATSTNGKALAPFKSGVFETACEIDSPISTAHIHYVTGENDPPAEDHVCWWGDASFVPHLVQLLNLSHIEAAIQFGSETVKTTDRKQAAKIAYAQILDLKTQIEVAHTTR